MDGQQKQDETRSRSKKGGGLGFRAMTFEASEPTIRHGSTPQTKDQFRAARFDDTALVPIEERVAVLIKTQDVPKPTPPGWSNPQLTLLGLYYPLGSNQTRLSQNDLYDVLRKLRAIFRAQSLHTCYTDSPISAICKSLDQVEFEVVLFAARDDSAKMILEVSRRDGDSMAYHWYAQQILRTVSDFSLEPLPVSPPSWNMNILMQADSIGDSDDESVGEAVEIAWKLVSSDRYDARRLGFESLVHMTDPNKCGWTAAKTVARSLIHPIGAIEEKLSTRVLEFACQSFPVDETEKSESDERASFSGITEADFIHFGLVIVSQTLQVAAGTKTMDVKTFLDVCPSDLVGSIIEKVGDVHRDPHRAYYAIRCLASLCRCVPSTKSRIKDTDVEEAQLVGEACHLALATVTKELLVSLQA